MAKAKNNKTEILARIAELPRTDMVKRDLVWLRKQMGSEDDDIRNAAYAFHNKKLFIYGDYSAIKSAKLISVEFYAQGEISDYPSMAEEYRHVRYVFAKNLSRTLYAGDYEVEAAKAPITEIKPAPDNMSGFFASFMDKIDELFTMYGSERNSETHDKQRERINSERDNAFDADNQDETQSEDVHYFFPENTTARWSMRIKFSNGECRSVAMDGGCLLEAGSLLSALDGYYDTGRMIELIPHKDWLGHSDDQVSDWRRLY